SCDLGDNFSRRNQRVSNHLYARRQAIHRHADRIADSSWRMGRTRTAV
ncbi:uncharacterized protein METZ01_LOCUS179490, partial [marine metagenome]